MKTNKYVYWKIRRKWLCNIVFYRWKAAKNYSKLFLDLLIVTEDTKKHQKMSNLLTEQNNSKFYARKWNIVHDQSNANYDVGNRITYKTEVLESNLCDYNNTYILVNGDIAIIGHEVTQIAFKDCAYLLNISQKLMEQQ